MKTLQISVLAILSLFLLNCGEEPVEEPQPVDIQVTDTLKVLEGNQPSKIIFLELRLENVVRDTATLFITTVSQSSNEDDYKEIEREPIFISPGDLKVDIEVEIFGDKEFEEDEIVKIIYESSSNIRIEENDVSVIVIENDDVDTSLRIPETGYTTPESYDGYDLVWRDEFDQTALDQNFWSYEIGGSGWGNNELQYYTRNNTSMVDGNLVIEARSESVGGRFYTSSRIVTQDKFEFQYGRVDVRAVLPFGQGIWPAVWMLGANFPEIGWPRCGEIDIMELVGGENKDNVVHGTAHWQDVNNKADFGNAIRLQEGIFNDEYHVFSIEWDEQKIVWYMDDLKFHEMEITRDALSEFRAPFFFIMNVAVGGNWPGSPNATTYFPQRMIVDYIRVFQKQ